MEKFKKSLDELIYAWSKVNQEVNSLSNEEEKFVKSTYPFDADFSDLLHKLIDWRADIEWK